MTLAIGQGIILSGKSYFHYIRNSSNFEDFEGFCYHYLGQYHFSCLYMAKNWMNTCFYPRKKILECKHLNLANLRSNERPFVEIYKICSEIGILSSSQKLENEDFLCFFGQMLAKMSFWCWPMLKNCQKWYLGAS